MVERWEGVRGRMVKTKPKTPYNKALAALKSEFKGFHALMLIRAEHEAIKPKKQIIPDYTQEELEAIREQVREWDRKGMLWWDNQGMMQLRVD